MEEIIILGKSIINDIRMMDKKSLDISLIQDDKSDITFFNIDEEESNEPEIEDFYSVSNAFGDHDKFFDQFSERIGNILKRVNFLFSATEICV